MTVLHTRLRMIALLLLLPALAVAQPRPLTAHDLFKIHTVIETALSPDGSMVAFTVNIPRPFTDTPGSDYRELRVLNAANGQFQTLLSGAVSPYSVAWRPDGRAVSFLARLEGSPVPQVWEIELDAGAKPAAVTSSATPVLAYAHAPQGRSLAWVAEDVSDPAAKALAAKGFNQELYEEEWKHRTLHVLDRTSGASRALTSGVSVFEFVWSPDAKRIAAAVAEQNLVDHEYMFKRIRLIDASTGALTPLVENPGKLGTLAWSPDGRRLAFISAVDVSDSKDGSLFVVEVDAPKPFAQLRNYTKGFEGTVIEAGWKDATTLLYASEEGVDITLREFGIDAQRSKIVLPGGQVVFGGFSYSAGRVALAGSTPAHPAELFTLDLRRGALQRRTTHNEWLSGISLGRQESVRYKARDGLEITGVLIYPVNYTEGTRYPLIMQIHGGPEAAYQNGWLTNYGNWGQVAAGRGYAVFHPNYRASTGRGVEYLRMGLGDLAGKEFDDVIDGIDYLVGRGIARVDRVGIGGGSYGGYFAAWGATRHSDRFAASVVFVGVSNQISKRNTTDIPWEDYHVHWGIWTHENAEKVYDRSPVKWATNSRTPTLILHGKEDPRVHPSQGLELYRSLKVHGKAPVRLVWYPGEGHGNRRNPARLDYALRTMEWFDWYLKDAGPKDRLPPGRVDYGLE